MNTNGHHHQHRVVIPYLLQALRAIPQHEKAEWLHVLRVAPHLVESESDPFAFLRFCDFNPSAAARRLTVYWRMRKEVFGEKRAFLPLLNDFSGNGALGREEIECLEGGGFCVTANDRHGRAVVYNDRNKIPPMYREKTDVKVRCWFLVLTRLARNPLSQQTGAIAVIRFFAPTSPGDNTTKRVTQLIHEALPLRVHKIHMIFIRMDKTGLMEYLVPFLLRQYGRFFFNKLVTHNFNSVEQVVESLARHAGISRESLPRDMGGLAGTDATATAPSLNSDAKTVNNLQLLNDTIGNVGRGLLLDSEPAAQSPKHFELVDPTPIQSPPQQQMRTLPAPKADDDNVDFTEMLEQVAFEPAGSPFEFRPIRSPLEPMCSPFEPSPIRSPSPGQQHPVGTSAGFLPVDVPLHNRTAQGTTRFDSSVPTEGYLQDLLQPQVSTNASTLPTSVDSKVAPLLDNDFPVVETPDVMERSLAALKGALSGITDAEQAAYIQAIQTAPALVQTESDPLAYLRFEKHNAWAAANRLVAYWKYRAQYFGDRAFSPLTQIRGGALWEEDLRTLATGYLFFLPKDSRGRPVLCCDPSKFAEDASKASHIRVAFYFFSILWREYPAALTAGCVIIVFVSPTWIMKLSRFSENIREAVEIVLDSFPIKDCGTHVIYSPSTSRPLPSFSAVVLPVLLGTVGRLLIQEGAHFHINETRKELERKLALCGLSGATLSAAVGGGISEDEFAQWMVDRQSFELQLCAHGQQQEQQQLHEPQQNQHEKSPPLPLAAVFQDSSSGTSGHRIHPPPDPTPDCLTGPQDIKIAMELVSAPEKRAYLEAAREVPDLVRKESDAVRFLEYENYNSVAAAKRLAAYWRIRHDAFRSRALLPLTQTHEGALDLKDVAALQTGFLTQLPNDSAGCSVICCDGTLLEKPYDPSSLLRIFFYLWSLVSQNDTSHTAGYTVLYTITDLSSDRACRNFLDLVMETLPVKLKSFHLLGCCPDDTSESDFRNGTVRDMMNLLSCSVQDKVIVHVCRSRALFANELVGHGLSRSGLPKAFGGEWGFDNFLVWQELRVRFEWNLPIRTCVDDFHAVAESYSIPSTFLQSNGSRLSDDEKAERQRRLSVVHARRRRARARIELLVLNEQCSSLREEKKQLLREGHELEELLQRAKAIVNEK